MGLQQEKEDVLDSLYNLVSESDPTDSPLMREKYKQLNSQMEMLSIEQNNAVFGTTVEICQEAERLAFRRGALLPDRFPRLYQIRRYFPLY